MVSVIGINVELACAIIFAVCIFYTTIVGLITFVIEGKKIIHSLFQGGIKAVMWTDAFQAIMMFGSFLAVIIKGNADAGGSHVVFDRNYQTSRIELFNFDTSLTTRHTVWSMIIGGYFTWISVYGINQTQVQRYLTVPNKKKVVKAIWWNVLGIGSLLLMCAYAGLVIFAFYDIHQCDPIKAKMVDKADQLFPLFVMQVMGDIPCIPGLFIAGVFSGALSTVSSGLNSLAAVVFQDILISACGKEFPEKTKTFLTKGLAAGFGFLSFGVVFMVKYLPGVLEAALGIFGIVGGPVLGGFTLGMFIPWANSLGAFVGMFSSLIFTMWFGFGQTFAKNFGTYESGMDVKSTTIDGCPANIFNLTATTTTTTLAPPVDDYQFPHVEIYNVSYMWFSAIPCMMTIVLGTLVSLIHKPQDPKTLNPKLVSPVLPQLFQWWPKFTGIYDYILGLKIGSQYVESEKCRRIRSQQIMTNNNDEPVVINNQVGKIEETNAAFELNEKM